MTQITDEQQNLERLLAEIARKEMGALNELYDATVERVYHLAVRITHSPEEAEEVVCDVYMQVWEQASAYNPKRASAMGWLMVICRSRALDKWRRLRKSRDHEVSLENTIIARDPQLRLEPGAQVPSHTHDSDEHCIVLEGQVCFGEIRVEKGDYHLARAGSRHENAYSETGALLYIQLQKAA